MIRQLRLLALILFTTAGMAWPAEVAAQRRATRPVHRGGGAAVAVPIVPPRSYRPYLTLGITIDTHIPATTRTAVVPLRLRI